MAGDAFPVFRFSTEAIPEPARPGILRETYARQFVNFDFKSDPDRPINMSFAARALPGLSVTSGVASGFRGQRTRSMLGDADETMFFAATLRGKVEPRQRGKDVQLGAGDAVLLSTGEPQEVRISGTVAYLGVQLTRTLLAPLVRGLDDAVMRRVPADLGALALFTRYANSLIAEEVALSPDLAKLAVIHLCDLTALALGATRDAAAVAAGRGVRAARLKALQDEIVANLQGPLSLDWLAARQGISQSYVRKLFESEGTSFSDFVLSQRLHRAHRLLGDPAHSHRPIGAIAFEVGFGDLSYFNRAFRRRFGLTPSDVREIARRGN